MPGHFFYRLLLPDLGRLRNAVGLAQYALAEAFGVALAAVGPKDFPIMALRGALVCESMCRGSGRRSGSRTSKRRSASRPTTSAASIMRRRSRRAAVRGRPHAALRRSVPRLAVLRPLGDLREVARFFVDVARFFAWRAGDRRIDGFVSTSVAAVSPMVRVLLGIILPAAAIVSSAIAALNLG